MDYSNFTEVVATDTGKKQMVPNHWLEHPEFSKSFKLPPSARAEKSNKD